MEIRETLFTKSFSTESENPYVMSLEFMKKLSETYRIYERKNIYQTDGPTKKAILVFDVIEILDKFSRIRISFSMEGENNTLYVNIVGEFVLKMKEYGFFGNVFSEFYLNNVFPLLRKVSEKRVKELEVKLENP